ncbi:lantibiotic immunity ABC transporter MutE/EpiE family permease subunit [Desulfotomaculum copahuensis]|uniref:Multidrug ABC transporter permease n=1 Tax=Desulfotomaculum copahuensis TaxID=1838280 RepID=A0A1B7LKN6_9FIRM|nr:lantibiotic immunity ABC transporter MutE/EpiE family permease subunit [Desulfotomaculum copahuensis]OAT87129.1 multidrug ABC transporter permease [Desulfotomaculum copahuensis]
MINIIQAEYMKYKRTFTRKLIVLAPLFFTIIALPQKFLMLANHLFLRPWQLLLDQIYNIWPVIFIPLGTALFAALVQAQEKRAGNYRGLRMHNVSPVALWTGKIIVMAGHTLLATLVLMISIIISGLITAGGAVPWLKIFAGGFTIWFVSLAIIPLQLWAATWPGIVASMTLGILGLIAGVAAAPRAYWIYIPWSWPARLMCPIIGVHPNGTLLEPGSRLLDPAVILPGFAVSLAALLIFTAITAWWFNKREVL